MSDEILASIEGRRLGFTSEDQLHFKQHGLMEFRAVFVPVPDTSYTLQNRDTGCVLLFTSDNAVALTLGADVYPGFNCMLFQLGTGAVQFVVTDPVAMKTRQNFTQLGGQYALGTMICYDNNEDLNAAQYVFGGDGA